MYYPGPRADRFDVWVIGAVCVGLAVAAAVLSYLVREERPEKTESPGQRPGL